MVRRIGSRLGTRGSIAWWSRLYGYASFAPIAVVWMLLMILFGGVEVTEIGPIRLASSAPIAVMLTFVGGFIVNSTVWIETNVSLPNSLGFAAARVGAACSVLCIACMVTAFGVVLRASDPTASLRNLVFAFGAFYWTQRVAPFVYWLIPTSYLLGAMFFGMTDADFAAWALPLVAGESSPHLLFTGTLLAVTLADIALVVPRTQRT